MLELRIRNGVDIGDSMDDGNKKHRRELKRKLKRKLINKLKRRTRIDRNHINKPMGPTNSQPVRVHSVQSQYNVAAQPPVDSVSSFRATWSKKNG